MPSNPFSGFSRFFGVTDTPHTTMAAVARAAEQQGTYRDQYALLAAYYRNNALYDQLGRLLYEQGMWSEALKPLRNPVYRIVEFYTAKLWGGPLAEALEIETENEAIIEPIERIWKWSQWDTRKQVASRCFAEFGDLFIKVVASPDRQRVYFQLLDPADVTSFEKDDREFLTRLRIDVPKLRYDEAADRSTPYTYTEVWDASGQRTWEHERGLTARLNTLPAPLSTITYDELGIDFIPVTHTKFRDELGHERGQAACMPAIDKIDEANRMATRLHQMLFRNSRVFWALEANQVGADLRPMPAPRIVPDDGNGHAPSPEDGTIALGDDRMYRLPGMSRLVPLVPDLNYEAMRQILADHLAEIREDLPELAYYQLREMADPSGRAVRLLLSDATDRVVEARGNGYAGLSRADMMALSLGKALRLEGFEAVGDFDSGDLEHSFTGPDVVPVSEYEAAETKQLQATAAVTANQVGVSKATLVEELGYDAAEEAVNSEAETKAAMEQMQREFDQNRTIEG